MNRISIILYTFIKKIVLDRPKFKKHLLLWDLCTLHCLHYIIFGKLDEKCCKSLLFFSQTFFGDD